MVDQLRLDIDYLKTELEKVTENQIQTKPVPQGFLSEETAPKGPNTTSTTSEASQSYSSTSHKLLSEMTQRNSN